MTHDRFETISSGYCAVSGSPVGAQDRTRYLLRLQHVAGGGQMVSGFMYYCCWPCVCDTQDFLKVDTANITLAGEVRQYYVVVIGNPCENEAALDKPFVQPFHGRETTTLRRDAAEVRCDREGNLVGASLSDHGYPIVAIFFEPTLIDSQTKAVAVGNMGEPQPGRLMTSASGLNYNDEYEFKDMCLDRAANGYNSGMGEIFRKVAEISKIIPGSRTQMAPQLGNSADGNGSNGNESGNESLNRSDL